MKKIVTICFFLFFGQLANAQEKIKTIHFASEEWPRATEKNGDGLYWDIFRKVYKAAKIDIKFDLVPYSRSMNLAKNKKVDAAVAAYWEEVEGVYYSELPFDLDVTAVVFLKNNLKTWKGEHSLAGKKVGWIRGYDFNDYLSVPVLKREVNKRKQGYSMLNKNRIDFYMDALTDLDIARKQGLIDDKKHQVEIVNRLNMYLVFSKNPRGKKLKDIFDQIFPTLVKSGELRRLFNKWQILTYPFNEKGIQILKN